MKYQKIQIEAGVIRFEKGAILGLGTKFKKQFEGHLKEVGPHLYEVTLPVAFHKGDVLWALRRDVPPQGVTLLSHARDYLEPDPVEAAATAKLIRELKTPPLNPRWKSPHEDRPPSERPL